MRLPIRTVLSCVLVVACAPAIHTGRLVSASEGVDTVAFKYDTKGGCWVTLADGEDFVGEYTTVQDASQTKVYRRSWDWQPAYTAKTTGASETFVSATGSRGTKLQCRIYNGKAGECIDSKGNHYTVHLK